MNNRYEILDNDSQFAIQFPKLTFITHLCKHFMKNIEEIIPLLDEPKKIVIVMHLKPDADAMGSSLGLFHFLIQFGHSINVVCPTIGPIG